VTTNATRTAIAAKWKTTTGPTVGDADPEPDGEQSYSVRVRVSTVRVYETTTADWGALDAETRAELAWTGTAALQILDSVPPEEVDPIEAYAPHEVDVGRGGDQELVLVYSDRRPSSFPHDSGVTVADLDAVIDDALRDDEAVVLRRLRDDPGFRILLRRHLSAEKRVSLVEEYGENPDAAGYVQELLDTG
jgi:hypothetical protein